MSAKQFCSLVAAFARTRLRGWSSSSAPSALDEIFISLIKIVEPDRTISG
jgi:hypothetical protein